MRKITQEMVNNASPLELTIINYELLIQNIDDAIAAIPNSTALSAASQKAKECVAVLYGNLNLGVDFSHDLAELYVFVNVALTKAGFADSNDQKNEMLNTAKHICSELLEAWKTIDPADVQKHIEATGQRFAGLTYGAGGSLTEFDDYDPDGGYKI
ncbi:MAG: flagellar protein FliS [Defluviitaleaceae bacterium]|nr:flagellar protein FliS [Defluviitaleaceae bacterium]